VHLGSLAILDLNEAIALLATTVLLWLLETGCKQARKTPPCRVQLSFEPAFAGWVPPQELRLGRGLSRYPLKIETIVNICWLKTGFARKVLSSRLQAKVFSPAAPVLAING
jgi:hypothetical protein